MANDKVLLSTTKFKVVQRDTPDGQSTIIQHPGAVVILPLLNPAEICLIKNLRRTVGRTLIELPAGTIESNEPPLQTAYRELAEETGYTADQITPLYDFYVSPGIMNEKMYAFVATGLQAGEQNLMDDEEIEVITAPFEQAVNWIREGKIQDAKTIATLLYFRHFGVTEP